MIRFISTAIVSILSVALSQAQSFSVSPSQIDMGVVLETQSSSRFVSIENLTSDAMTFEIILPVQEGFSAGQSSITIAGQGRDSVEVSFQPIHNVYHNQEMLILPQNGLGGIAIDLRAQGRYSNTYYSSTENQEGEALKAALKSRISQGYVQLSYNQARNEMYMQIDNQKTNGQGASVNTLECVYTGTLVTSYVDRTDAQLQGFNTEHTFPQGFFNQGLPMRSDIHHLFPTTQSSNSTRGNKPFGTVSNPTWQVGGSKSNSSRFEPRDVHKGAVARAVLYFVVRYQDYAGHLAQQETVLRQWHQAFPPTDVDKNRNDDVFSVQNNRNPFVDYPQFLDRISSISGTATVALESAYFLPSDQIEYDTVTGPRLYSYPIVNTGNTSLTVNAPVFSDPRLKDLSGTSFPTTLVPGEDLTLDIQLNTVGTPGLDATMTIDLIGADDISVPVTAFWTLASSIDQDWPESWDLLSTSEGFEIGFGQNEVATWKVITMDGRVLKSDNMTGSAARIRMTGTSHGIYLLEIQTNQQSRVRRVRW